MPYITQRHDDSSGSTTDTSLDSPSSSPPPYFNPITDSSYPIGSHSSAHPNYLQEPSLDDHSIPTRTQDHVSDHDDILEDEDDDDYPEDTADQEDEEDDAEVFARLLQRAENMRKGVLSHPPNQPNEPSAPFDGSHSPLIEAEGDVPMVDIQAEPDERHQQAVAFLESLMMDFLVQLSKSEEHLISKALKPSPTKSKCDTESLNNGKNVSKTDTQGQIPSQSSSDRCPPTGGVSPLSKSTDTSNRASRLSPDIKLTLTTRQTGADQIITFPDQPAHHDQWDREASLSRIACVFRVVSLLHEAVLSGITTTKRDIFYKDVNLFKHQRLVDKIVDNLVTTAGLKRADFNVCATSKGLIASPVLQVHLRSGTLLAMSAVDASLIPPVGRISTIEATSPPEWILIVEKDAVFNTLCAAGLLQDQKLGPGILITGKGYPDLATLQLSSLLAITYPKARVYVLVDADPHGIDIMSNYVNGARGTKFSKDHTGLALGGRAEWVGVKASDWFGLGVRHDDLIPLTECDVRKAHAMLRNQPDMPRSWKRELCEMLHLNRKAEIQIVLSSRSGLSGGQPPTSIYEPEETLGDEDGKNGENANGTNGKGGEGRENPLVAYLAERMGRPALPECQ